MVNVKRIFFLTPTEALKLREETGKTHIAWGYPCYELEDGTMMYAASGNPITLEKVIDVWYEEVKPQGA